MGLAPWSHVGAGVGGSFVVAYIVYDLVRNRKVFGGTVPPTLTKEWAEATDKRMDSWPREAGPPIVLNPISRGNYRKAE